MLEAITRGQRSSAMASITTEIQIDARAADVWAALRDFGALHQRLVPGFVVDAHTEGHARIVTFANGAIAREILVAIDDEARRLAYTVVDAPTIGFTHHSASAQVFDEGPDRSRFVWIADVLPHEVAAKVRPMMEQGTAVIKRTLESAALRV
jgi:carbon monoxide dehydrogenase subunit G